MKLERSVLVPLHVERQVIGAREAAVAGDAFERFGSGVLPVVPREFVGAGETPVTSLPGAAVRLLA